MPATVRNLDEHERWNDLSNTESMEDTAGHAGESDFDILADDGEGVTGYSWSVHDRDGNWPRTAGST